MPALDFSRAKRATEIPALARLQQHHDVRRVLREELQLAA